VVLLPTAFGSVPRPQVRSIESGNKFGCEIQGSKRTTRWWFEQDRNDVDVEVVTGNERHRYHVSGPTEPPAAQTGWLNRLRSLIGANP